MAYRLFFPIPDGIGIGLDANAYVFCILFFFRELRREKVWSRLHLVPLLLAEGDRDAYRRRLAALEREKEIMKDVKDWQVRLMFLLKRCGG